MTTGGAESQQREGALLELACAASRTVRVAEATVAVTVLEWAVTHPPVDEADRACEAVTGAGDRTVLVPLTGDGTPAVSAAAVAELAVVLGVSTESGRRLVADVLELAFRLPRVWALVLAAQLPWWRARRVAQLTGGLNRDAAEHVDRQLAAVAGRVGPVQLERLVEAAMVQHDPELAADRERAAAERRRFDVDLDQVGIDGLVPVGGVVELPDAMALEAAVAHGAAELARLGCSDARPARRARALGDLAREHLTLWSTATPDQPEQSEPTARTASRSVAETGEPAFPFSVGMGISRREHAAAAAARAPERAPETSPLPGEQRPARTPVRRLVLHLHLDAAAVLGPGTAPLGWVDDLNIPVTAATIRRWCGAVGTHVSVLPVLDMGTPRHTAGYAIPPRLREQVIARDSTCVFPGCARPARNCDLDHVQPYDHHDPAAGGPTATHNLAPLCRHHHNLKTAGHASYRSVGPGAYLWTFPAGTRARRDQHGTHLLATASPAGGTGSVQDAPEPPEP